MERQSKTLRRDEDAVVASHDSLSFLFSDAHSWWELGPLLM